MRITGGQHRGRVIRTHVSGKGDGVRPTASRVREALFSMLGQDLSGISVLDAFGGSGILGLEAWSRGAEPVTIVERSRQMHQQIERTAKELAAPVEVVRAEAQTMFRSEPRQMWDLVLLDPPYSDDPLLWAERAAPSARWALALEFRMGATFPATLAHLELVRERKYGQTGLVLYKSRTRAESRGHESDIVSDDLGVIEDDR